MRLVKPSVERLDVTTDPIKAIELAGRTCYKSEDKIGEGTADKFVKMLMKRGHHAMIEHSNFILSVDSDIYRYILELEDRKYIRMTCDVQGNGCLISGNGRALMDFCLRPDVKSEIQRMIALELSKKARELFQDTLRYTVHLSPADKDFKGLVEVYQQLMPGQS